MVKSIDISYRGSNAEKVAKSLHGDICKQLNLKINPPAEIPPPPTAELGIQEEVIITIFHAAAAVLAHEAWQKIKELLRNHFQNQNMRGQIGINNKRWFSFDKNTNWKELLERIEKYIKNKLSHFRGKKSRKKKARP